MDNFEYLNQISQSNRPIKRKNATDRKTSLIIKLCAAGVVLFFLLMAFGAMISNLNSKTTDLTKQLYSRTASLKTVITSYNSNLKSSQLRAITASLTTILTNASNQLSGYLTAKDKDKNALILDEKTAASENKIINELSESLNNAKLNGVLDRHYDNQINLQVSLLLSLTSQLLARTKDPDLIIILTNLHTSLEAIHQSLESYSNN